MEPPYAGVNRAGPAARSTRPVLYLSIAPGLPGSDVTVDPRARWPWYWRSPNGLPTLFGEGCGAPRLFGGADRLALPPRPAAVAFPAALGEAIPPGCRCRAGVVAAAVCVASGGLLLRSLDSEDLLRWSRGYASSVESDRIAAGRALRDATPPGSIVYAGHGHVARESHRRVIDLSGLNSRFATDHRLELPAMFADAPPAGVAIQGLRPEELRVQPVGVPRPGCLACAADRAGGWYMGARHAADRLRFAHGAPTGGFARAAADLRRPRERKSEDVADRR